MEVMWWIAFGLGVTGFLATAGLIGYALRGRRELRRSEERFEEVRLRRRNALLDAGRTTDRRPEHDGLPPGRNGRLRMTLQRLGPADQPRRRM